MSTLVALFNGISKDPNEVNSPFYFTFHATNAFQMNDKKEGCMLLDKFFTESEIKTQYKETYSQIVREEGEIHLISLCRSNKDSKDSGLIPMWGMYGSGGGGAILVFDFDKLQKYIEQQSDAFLQKCEYKSLSEINEFIKENNAKIKGENDKKAFLSSLRLEAFRLKNKHWEQENEWRIVVKSKDEKLKMSNNRVVSYTEVHIPVNCLSYIIIGPLVEIEPVKRILENTISNLRKSDDKIEDIRVNPSKLQMR